MEITLPPYPASVGPAAAQRLARVQERSAAARAKLREELELTVSAFERAFEVADRARATRDRIADTAKSQSQRIQR